VAAGTGGHALIELAAPKERLASCDQIGIGGTDTAFLAGEVRGDVCQILLIEVVQHAGHFKDYTFAVLDFMQLLEQIALALSGQLREIGRHAVTIRAMTGATDCGFCLPGGGISHDHISGSRRARESQDQKQTHQ